MRKRGTICFCGMRRNETLWDRPSDKLRPTPTEPRHFAVVQYLNVEAGCYREAVGNGFLVGGLGENVGDDHTGDFLDPRAQLAQRDEIAREDLDRSFDGGTSDQPAGKDVATEGERLLEEFERSWLLRVGTVENQH